MEFKRGQTALFNMIAFSEKICKRVTRIYGTKGELFSPDGVVSVLLLLSAP